MKNNVGLANEIITLYSAKMMDDGNYKAIIHLNKLRYDLYSNNDYSNQFKIYASKIKDNFDNYVVNNTSISSFKNDEDNEKKIYDLSTKIVDDIGTSETSIPTAVLIGGQQGSGKTEIVRKTIQDFYKKNKHIVLLDLDIYRVLYKNYLGILINNSDLYSTITNNSIGKLAEKLSSYVISKKYNFIFEGTMGKYPYTLDLLKKSTIKYNIIVKVMAVCREESILGIFERYIELKKATNIGRLTTIEDHDSRYFNLPKVINEIEKDNIEVEIYQRLNDSINMVYKTSSPNNKYENAEKSIIEARKKSYNDCVISLNTRIDNVIREFKNLNEYKKYNKVLNELKYMKKKPNSK